MALNTNLYRELLNQGIPHHAALILADPARDVVSAAAVSDPAAMTAPASMGATYTAANVNALRADVDALRTVVINLLTSLRNAGVVS